MAIPKWILVADDDAVVRDLWTLVLTRAGYRVLTARNGREALDLMRDVIPDLIILDLHMPEMDGPTFLKVLEGARCSSGCRCSSSPASSRTNPPALPSA